MPLWKRVRHDELLGRELLVGTTESDLARREQVLSSDQDILVRGTETSDGIPVLPVFTSEKRLVEWFREGSHWLALSGRDMLELFLRGEWEAMVVDPTQPTRREIFREDAKRLLDNLN